MKKKYTLLNSIIEIEGTKELIDYIDSNVIELPLYTKKFREYKVLYELNPILYDDIVNDLKDKNGEEIRIFGDKHVTRIKNDGIIFLMSDDSIIVRIDDKFSIYGKTNFSKNHVLYLIREAIYEGYILDNDLLLNSMAFSTNNEQGNIIISKNEIEKFTLLRKSIKELSASLISSDMVGIHNNKAIASINPIPEKLITYLETEPSVDSNVRVKNIIFPHANPKSDLNITKMDKKDAKDIMIGQILNYQDELRPYLWVNDIEPNQIKRKTIETKLGNLIGSSECFYFEYGQKISQDDVKVMKKVMKI